MSVNTSGNQSMKGAPRSIAAKQPARRLSIGGYALVGLPRAFKVGRSGPANVGQRLTSTPKQRQDVQPTWRGEFEDDYIHPAAVPSRVPITAGGVRGSSQKANAFRHLGDLYGGRG